MVPRRLTRAIRREETVKKSRFVTRLLPVADPAEVKALVDAVRKAEFGARHHATAMVIGPDRSHQRSSDDGEPAGSAGAPMLEVLRRERVTDVLAIVSRHFGGVLLGKAGLIRAYGGGVAAAVAAAAFETQQPQLGFEVRVRLAEAGRTDHLLRVLAGKWEHGIVRASYGEDAVFELWLPPEAAPAVTESLGGTGQIRALGQRLVTMAE
ncbi:MAG: YigZ family protein [Bifidobacteriaceae bacterium]|nr:YigZ family protein [Bifidobacteriaceae bacterium]